MRQRNQATRPHAPFAGAPGGRSACAGSFTGFAGDAGNAAACAISNIARFASPTDAGIDRAGAICHETRRVWQTASEQEELQQRVINENNQFHTVCELRIYGY
jgi:hypothetical protein